MLWYFIKLYQIISQEMYEYQFGEFVGLQCRNQNNVTLDICER